MKTVEWLERQVDSAICVARDAQNLADAGVCEVLENWDSGRPYDCVIDVLQAGIDRAKFLRDHKHDFVTEDNGSCVCRICGHEAV